MSAAGKAPGVDSSASLASRFRNFRAILIGRRRRRRRRKKRKRKRRSGPLVGNRTRETEKMERRERSTPNWLQEKRKRSGFWIWIIFNDRWVFVGGDWDRISSPVLDPPVT
jgi:hypothetical protein